MSVVSDKLEGCCTVSGLQNQFCQVKSSHVKSCHTTALRMWHQKDL